MHWFRVTQVRCDLLDVARAYLPAGFDLVRETELLCRSRADPHSAKDASGDRSAPAGTPTFSSSSSAAAAAAWSCGADRHRRHRDFFRSTGRCLDAMMPARCLR